MTPFRALLLTLLLSLNLLSQQDSSAWHLRELHYDRVVAYQYDGSLQSPQQLIIDHDSLNPRIYQQKELTAGISNDITALLLNPSTYTNTYDLCFEPHLGLVYYLQNKPVASVSVCLACHRIYSYNIPESYFNGLSGGRYYEDPKGLSEGAHNAFQSLCEALGFGPDPAPVDPDTKTSSTH